MITETAPRPIEHRPDWAKDYPATKEQALAEVGAALAAYRAWQLPVSWPTGTPEVTLEYLYQSKGHAEAHQVPETIPDLSMTRVPEGLEEWALRKIQLAHDVWTAEHRLEMFLTRISKEVSDRSASNNETAQQERREVTGVMLGHFEIRVTGQKPELVLNSYGDVASEIHQRLQERQREWFARHKSDLLSHFPKLSGFLELLSAGREAQINFLSVDEIYWFLADHMAASYGINKEEKNG